MFEDIELVFYAPEGIVSLGLGAAARLLPRTRGVAQTACRSDLAI